MAVLVLLQLFLFLRLSEAVALKSCTFIDPGVK